MKIGSLCSGYGGLDLGVIAALGGSVAWHVEYDAAPSKILAHHWPDVPNHGDVKTTDWSAVEPVDILTAGYPCQPFSVAGNRKGVQDDRHLWPDVCFAIGNLRPGLVVLENVRGHVSLGLDAVIGDLSGIGYDARWGIIRASDVGACHNRARLFIVATNTRGGPLTGTSATRNGLRIAPERSPVPTTDASGKRHGRWENSRSVGRMEGDDASQARQRQRSRAVVGDRGPAVAPDADFVGCESRTERLRDASLHAASGHVPAAWGVYASAIARWERTLGRPAPNPTELGRNRPRLAPVFVEWLMGLDPGHVTDPAIGLSPTQQLKALGNGVVPQQAAAAIRLLVSA